MYPTVSHVSWAAISNDKSKCDHIFLWRRNPLLIRNAAQRHLVLLECIERTEQNMVFVVNTNGTMQFHKHTYSKQTLTSFAPLNDLTTATRNRTRNQHQQQETTTKIETPLELHLPSPKRPNNDKATTKQRLSNNWGDYLSSVTNRHELRRLVTTIYTTRPQCYTSKIKCDSAAGSKQQQILAQQEKLPSSPSRMKRMKRQDQE